MMHERRSGSFDRFFLRPLIFRSSRLQCSARRHFEPDTMLFATLRYLTADGPACAVELDEMCEIVYRDSGKQHPEVSECGIRGVAAEMALAWHKDTRELRG
jgi:hypothetical protein